MESLYFIAIIPPEKIQDEITELKHEVAARFGSKHALKSPPHITLHMPFKWKDSRLQQLDLVMDTINGSIEPFEVELSGFDFFEPRVVFIGVDENKALGLLQKKVVQVCRKELHLFNANYKERPFHPHVTIGFRDLKKKMFYEAKGYFESQTYHSTFSVDVIRLLKHDGKRWHVVT